MPLKLGGSMDSKEIEKRRLALDDHMHVTEDGVEFWYAREVMGVFGYAQWRRFEETIKRAMISLESSKTPVRDHFADVGKMVPLGSGAERSVKDYMLTRYACYLIAQNGDPRKEEIAFAQSYFALQTRKQELIEQRMLELRRLTERDALTESEKVLARHSLRARCRPAGVCDHQIKRGRGPVRRKQHEGHEEAPRRAREEAPCRRPSRRDHGGQEPCELNDVI